MKLYNASIAALPIKDFEGTNNDVQTWINDLIERTLAMNWTSILTVALNGLSFFIPKCLTLTIQQVQEHAKSYLFAPQGRPKQNSAVLYWCLNHQHNDTKKKGMWVSHEPSKCNAKGGSGKPHQTQGDLHTTATAMTSIISAYEEDKE
jgi:hypothetical protein